MQLGWKPDPKKKPGEKQDFNAAELLGSLSSPGAASNRQLVLSVLDQGRLSSCVANAGFQAVRASHVRQGITNPKLGSRLFGYYMARAYHHETAHDDGTYIRMFFMALNKFGFCPEDVYPYSDDKGARIDGPPSFARMPSTKAFRAAFDQKAPTTYRRIYSTGYERVEDVKRALFSGYLVVFGTDVTQRFADGDFDASQPVHRPTSEPIAGGHAMCLVGYSGDVFEVVNSWGSDWGDGGWCKFAADYVAWNDTRDLWIVEHSPPYS